MNFKKFFSIAFSVMTVVAMLSFSSCGESTEKDTNDETTEETTENNTTDETVNNNKANNSDNTANADVTGIKSGKVNMLSTEQFKQLVFNYEANQEWNYLGDLPCVIDFYADWCGPCKMVAPIMDELAEEYEGKVMFYKVDVDAEGELAGAFGIQSIPSVLFCPSDNSQPEMATGAMQKDSYVSAISEVLGVQ